MKRTLLFVPCLLILFSLSGCFDYKEINDTAMVAGIGIDRGESAVYRVSVEVINPASGESGSPSSKIFFEEGESVADCLKRLVNVTAKELRFSHCKLILFSEEVAKDGISSIVDSFLRDPEYRPDLFLAVFRERCSDMLGAGEKEQKVSSFEYASVIRNSYGETGSVPPTRLYQFSMDGVYTLLPVFEKKNDRYFVCGAAGFRDGRMFTCTDLKSTQSILLVSGEYRHGELLLSDGNVEIPCQIRSVSVRKSLLCGEPDTVDTEIECSLRLTALPKMFNLSTAMGVDVAERRLAELLEGRLQEDWERLRRNGNDVLFGLSVYLYRYHPERYQNLDNADRLRLQVRCTVHLENSGFSDERIEP